MDEDITLASFILSEIVDNMGGSITLDARKMQAKLDNASFKTVKIYIKEKNLIVEVVNEDKAIE